MSGEVSDPWEGLPGADVVRRGLADLDQGIESEFALLVLLAKPRLIALEIVVNDQHPNYRDRPEPAGHALYSFIEERYGADAHSRYNSLLRTMSSFARALERERFQAATQDIGQRQRRDSSARKH